MTNVPASNVTTFSTIDEFTQLSEAFLNSSTTAYLNNLILYVADGNTSSDSYVSLLDVASFIAGQAGASLPPDAVGVLTNDGLGSLSWSAGATGVTNVTVAETPTNVSIESSTGTNDVIEIATGTNAGVMSPADKTKLDFLTITSAVDLDAANVAAISVDVADHQAALGIADGAQDFGTFTSLPDNQDLLSILTNIDARLSGITIQNVVADIVARDAQTGASNGDLTYVVDASADGTVDSGAALYVWDGSAYQKISEFESLDVVSDLAVGAITTTIVPVTNSNGTGFIVPAVVPDSVLAAADGTAGVMSSAQAEKLDRLGSFSADIGGAAANTVTHNLGTNDVSVVVKRIADNTIVTVPITTPTVNTVVVTFPIAIAAASYRVSVVKAA